MAHIRMSSPRRRSVDTFQHNDGASIEVVTKLKDAFQTSPGPAKIFIPEFHIGEEVIVNDNCTMIQGTVYSISTPNRYEVIDRQGFIHITEPTGVKGLQEASLRCIVSPKSKFSAGYDQSQSGGVKCKPRITGMQM